MLRGGMIASPPFGPIVAEFPTPPPIPVIVADPKVTNDNIRMAEELRWRDDTEKLRQGAWKAEQRRAKEAREDIAGP